MDYASGHQGNGEAMPRRAKPPRLYLDPKRQQWVIRDGQRFLRTGCGERDSAGAEKFLAQYIGFKHKPEASGAPMIADVLNIYGKEVAAHKKTARNIGYQIGSLLKWWGDKTVAEVSVKNCRAYAATRPPQAAAGDLKVLRAAVLYWHNEEGYGPLNFIPKFWQPPPNPPKERWLTKAEAARLLKSAKPYPYLRRFILLGLYTGSRPGVIFALKWAQVDFNAGVLYRVPRGVSQDAKKRAPPVRLGRRILAHLRRWHRLDNGTGFICNFEGRQISDPHGSWAKVIKVAGLEGVTRHTLRHTRATWMAQKGVPLFEAAGFLGMTVKTLDRVYAHHHPDWQERAANI